MCSNVYDDVINFEVYGIMKNAKFKYLENEKQYFQIKNFIH